MSKQKNNDKKQTFELEVDADKNNFSRVMLFLEQAMLNVSCSFKIKNQINLVSEEIFINIAQYAYGSDKTGKIKISLDILKDNPQAIEIIFKDQGMKYNPLKKNDPDITLSAEERQVGGLGIFMTKKIVDDIKYEYKSGYNILCIKKIIQ